MLRRVDDITRFALDARPGDCASYGRGDRPPEDLVRASRPYVDAGVLLPTAKREAGGFLFLLQRTSSTAQVRLPRSTAAEARSWRRKTKAVRARVLLMLLTAAKRGWPCPTYAQIAQRCQLSRKGAESHVRSLIRHGQILSEHDPQSGWRVITICSGQHAGLHTMRAPGESQPHSERTRI